MIQIENCHIEDFIPIQFVSKKESRKIAMAITKIYTEIQTDIAEYLKTGVFIEAICDQYISLQHKGSDLDFHIQGQFKAMIREITFRGSLEGRKSVKAEIEIMSDALFNVTLSPEFMAILKLVS